MPTLRRAKADDALDFILLMKQFLKSADYPFKVDTNYTLENFQSIVDHEDFFVVLATDGDELVGFLVGAVSSTLFSRDRTAVELGWFVDPEYRDGSTGLKMMMKFEKWAENKGCRHSTMVDIDTLQDLAPLYTRRGYTLTEKTYVKEL